MKEMIILVDDWYRILHYQANELENAAGGV